MRWCFRMLCVLCVFSVRLWMLRVEGSVAAVSGCARYSPSSRMAMLTPKAANHTILRVLGQSLM